MKKILLTLIATATSFMLFAEGYQVNVLSTKQTGMGHVGTAMKLGAESIHFNPAGLTYMDHTMDISAGISGIMAKAKYTKGDDKAHTHNPISTPMYAYFGYKIYDNLAAGISLTTPYGSSLKWPKNWVGADLIQDITLKSFVLQPTVSYKIMDGLSIGAGLQLGIGNVELSRGLMPVGFVSSVIATLPPPLQSLIGVNGDDYKDVVPASATLTGKTKVAVGFNIGAMYDVNEKVTIGLSYRSKLRMKVKEGDAKLDYASEDIRAAFKKLGDLTGKPLIPNLEEGTFKAELPLPANLTLGVSYRPTDRWELSADLQYVFWNAYDSLNVKFTENVLNGYEINAEKNYKNSMIYRVGAQYRATERLDVRAGIYYDESPIRSSNYNPETPGMDKIGLSTGVSFEPLTNFQIDFAFLYIQGIGRDGSYTYMDVVEKKQKTFEGHYNSNAYNLSLGLSYKF